MENFNGDVWVEFHKITWFKFVLQVIFSRKFRCGLQQTIFYAVRHHQHYLHQGASDVVIFLQYFREVIKHIGKEGKGL